MTEHRDDPSAPGETVARLARQETGRLLALLAARFGLDLADEALQDAFVEALNWREEPDNPVAWLYTVARNRAIDRLRREAATRRREHDVAANLAALEPTTYHLDHGEEEPMTDPAPLGDERLRLILLCCHPALAPEAQIALTLRLVGGLTTQEIAAALLVPEPTLAQRIVRAKRKIRDAGIPLSIPDRLDDRLEVTLGVLYLIFNEGYLSRGSTDGTRIDLMTEATRLTATLLTEVPENPEVEGLLALQLYTASRSATRFADGELVLLEDQDRTRWDGELIEQANAILDAAMRRNEPGPHQLQAVIARYHATARTAADTDWPAIGRVYARLREVGDSAVVALNHTVAVAMADGPLAGLAMLDAVRGLEGYHLYWATRGTLLARAGRPDEAVAALTRARALTDNPAEQRHLDRRLAELGR